MHRKSNRMISMIKYHEIGFPEIGAKGLSISTTRNQYM